MPSMADLPTPTPLPLRRQNDVSAVPAADSSVDDADSLARSPNYFCSVQDPWKASEFAAEICDLLEKWGRISMDETFVVS